MQSTNALFLPKVTALSSSGVGLTLLKVGETNLLRLPKVKLGADLKA